MPAPINSPNPDMLFVGKGILLFDRHVAGVSTGLRHMGNVELLELTTEDDKLTKKSSMTPSAPTYKEVVRERNVNLKITCGEYTQRNLALALMGDETEVTQAATPVVDEQLTNNAALGAYYRTAKLGPISVVTVSQGMASLVAGTDYEITDAAVGLIYILPTSPTVTPGSILLIDYTPTVYAANTGVQRIRGGTQTAIEGTFVLRGDPSVGPKLLMTAYRVSVSPDGAQAFISDEWANIGLNGLLLDDSAGLHGGSVASPIYDVLYL